MPDYYNTIEADVIYEENISIEDWTVEECYKRWKCYLEQKWRDLLAFG
jgi:hypothetical protein